MKFSVLPSSFVLPPSALPPEWGCRRGSRPRGVFWPPLPGRALGSRRSPLSAPTSSLPKHSQINKSWEMSSACRNRPQRPAEVEQGGGLIPGWELVGRGTRGGLLEGGGGLCPLDSPMESWHDPSRGQVHPCRSPQMGPRCFFTVAPSPSTRSGLGGCRGETLCPPLPPSPKTGKEGG